jgi:NADH:ubiquinone oxidoreductase subunit 2 (subunit N)
VAGLGDADHDLDNYRGLARRQPWLAVPMIIFLLAQAGMPATTGLWAKVYIIEGVVGTPGGDALAVIAMVSAVIAAFFYLRLVLYMVSSPVAEIGSETVGDPMPAVVVASQASSAPHEGVRGAPFESGSHLEAVAALEARSVATMAAPADGTVAPEDGTVAPEDTEDQQVMVIPLSTAAAITICAGFTVLFGLWPSPIINFAHAATLLLH